MKLIDKDTLVAEIEKKINAIGIPRDKIEGGVLYELGNLQDFINSLEVKDLQEKPVSIWHDSNKEQPNFASSVAIWDSKYKNGEIISRCTKVYSDRIWAYIDDLLNL